MGRLASEVAEPVLGAADAALWHAHRARPWEGTGAVIRVSWLPASLDAVLTLINEFGNRAARVELSGRAGIGTGLLRVDGDAATQLDVVRRLRARPDLFRQVTVLRAAPAVKTEVDVWGVTGDTAALHQAIKRAFDPAGILNAGRGPV